MIQLMLVFALLLVHSNAHCISHAVQHKVTSGGFMDEINLESQLEEIVEINTICANVTPPVKYSSNYFCENCTRRLQIVTSNITEIKYTTFLGMDVINVLTMEGVYASRIGSQAFAKMNNLRELRLSHNRLVNISNGAFRGLAYLQILDLSDNHIKTISRDWLHDSPNLKYLNLSSNFLRIFNCTALDELIYVKCLDVSNNAIRDINFGEHTTRVEYLNLSNNVVNNMIGCPTGIRILDLSYNDMVQLPNVDHCPKSKVGVVKLYLAENLLDSLKRGFFKAFPNLQYLGLQHNFLSSVPSDLFGSTLPFLEGIDLSHNLFMAIDATWFATNKNLRYVDMSYNAQIGSVNGARINTMNLELHMEGNNIETATLLKIIHIMPAESKVYLGFLNHRIACVDMEIIYSESKKVNVTIIDKSKIHCIENFTSVQPLNQKDLSNIQTMTTYLSDIKTDVELIKSNLGRLQSSNSTQGNFRAFMKEINNTLKVYLDHMRNIKGQSTTTNDKSTITDQFILVLAVAILSFVTVILLVAVFVQRCIKKDHYVERNDDKIELLDDHNV